MTADTVGGVWTYACELVRGLCSRGIDVILATMGAPVSDFQRSQLADLKSLIIAESSFKLEWMPGSAADVAKAGDWLCYLERQYHPDIVHLNNYAHAALPFSAPVIVVGHSCITSWWSAVHGRDLPEDFDQYRSMVKTSLRCADLVIAPSRAMLDCLELHYGPVESKRVIYNGRTPSNLNLGHKEDIILSVGRLWDQAKNSAILESIAADIPWPIYIAGSNRHPDGYDVNFTNVKFLGSLSPDQLALWYARAGIYCLPARYEPFGLSALEAAQAGCTLVLGDIPSLREIWSDAAVFVPPNDSRQLRRVILNLVSNPSLCDQLALCAYHRARDFLPRRMVDQYLEAYTDVLNNSVVCV